MTVKKSSAAILGNNNHPITKRLCIDMTMNRFIWILNRVIEDHGHTISLMEAALIAESMPDRYDYDAYITEIKDLTAQEIINYSRNNAK